VVRYTTTMFSSWNTTSILSDSVCLGTLGHVHALDLLFVLQDNLSLLRLLWIRHLPLLRTSRRDGDGGFE
jgi:hypothetical protein